MKALLYFIGFIVIVAVFGQVGKYAADRFTGTTTDTTVNGYVMSESAFNSYCIQGALSTEGVTRELANSYCTCLYRTGVAQYGAEAWTKELETLGATSTLTPKMNQLVNGCVELSATGTSNL